MSREVKQTAYTCNSSWQTSVIKSWRSEATEPVLNKPGVISNMRETNSYIVISKPKSQRSPSDEINQNEVKITQGFQRVNKTLETPRQNRTYSDEINQNDFTPVEDSVFAEKSSVTSAELIGPRKMDTKNHNLNCRYIPPVKPQSIIGKDTLTRHNSFQWKPKTPSLSQSRNLHIEKYRSKSVCCDYYPDKPFKVIFFID